jgi:hypothetical protein
MKCLLTALEQGEGLASDGSVLSGVQLACDALFVSGEDGEPGVINTGSRLHATLHRNDGW